MPGAERGDAEVAARSRGRVGRTHATSSAASTAAPNWTIQYQTASSGEIRRVTRKPSVTAGLKKPPEMNPTAETMTRDHEAVREREVGRRARVRGTAAGDEDQRERADELGDAPADVVALQHGANPIPRRRTACRDATHASESRGCPGERTARPARCRRSSARRPTARASTAAITTRVSRAGRAPSRRSGGRPAPRRS